MKLRLLCTLVVALIVPALASAKKKPSSQGYIVFDKNCDIAATDFDIDVPPAAKTATVAWKLIDQGCGDPLKVAVGGFRRGKYYYYPMLLNCNPNSAQLGTPTDTIKCDLNLSCLGVDDTYTFEVCVDGAPVFDPELRIKGGGRPGASRSCSTTKDVNVGKKDCIAWSK